MKITTVLTICALTLLLRPEYAWSEPKTKIYYSPYDKQTLNKQGLSDNDIDKAEKLIEFIIPKHYCPVKRLPALKAVV